MSKKEILNNIDSIKKINIRNIESLNSSLLVIEGGHEISFTMRRVFYIQNKREGTIRGNHAHKKCNQLLIALNMAIEVKCTDGIQEYCCNLNSPNTGLFIPNMIWSVQKYISKNSLLLVLTDMRFDESDYIRDYDEFLEARS